MKYLNKTHATNGVLETVISSIPTGAKSPEEILETLDRYDIDWYVTDKGTLMIRYWQVGAEEFVSGEQAAIIRSGRPSPGEGNELDWLNKNLQNIREEYGGQWVAIHGSEIVAAAPNLPELMNQTSGLDRPLITFIPEDPIVWTFTYAYEEF